MTITASQNYTIEEYLVMEERSLEKHEFHDGKIIKMSGGTVVHNQLGGKVITQLNNVIDAHDAPFRVYTSDMKIRIESVNRFVYPDAVVVTIKPEFYKKRKDVITNPLLVVEVSSNSSAAFDLDDKFNLYRSIVTFQEYLIVSQEKYHVSRFYREATDLWRTFDYYSLDEMILLQSMGLEISMTGIYKGVDLNV